MTREELLERLVVEQHSGSPDELLGSDPVWVIWRSERFDPVLLLELVEEAEESYSGLRVVS